MRSRFVLALLFSFAAVACPAPAAFPGANGDLAVGARFGCDGFQVDAVARDGSALRPLTARPCEVDGASNGWPEWSVDGRRVFFYSHDRREFASVSADGSDLRGLGISPLGTPPEPYLPVHLRPSLSPGGTRLAFSRAGSVWTARLADGSARRLRAGIEPRYSPDGRRIAYVAVPRAGARELWLMDARNGRRLRRLSRNAAEIDWSPDGRGIVFARPTSGSNRDLFVARADGRGIRRLTRTARIDEGAPVFSPDGRFVAFARGGSGETQERGDIAYVPAGGGRQRTIVVVPPLDADTPFEASLSWGPAGR